MSQWRKLSAPKRRRGKLKSLPFGDRLEMFTALCEASCEESGQPDLCASHDMLHVYDRVWDFVAKFPKREG
jgi:hypothetical protein